MVLLPEDSIDNYIEVDIPVLGYAITPTVHNRYKYKEPEDGKTLEIMVFDRGGSYNSFTLQPDGPQGEFPVGRGLSITNPRSHEELIITDLTLFRYSDRLLDGEYHYKIEDNYFYAGEWCYIDVYD
jgi:hypothetical protein